MGALLDYGVTLVRCHPLWDGPDSNASTEVWDMPVSHEMQELLDRVKQEVEQAVYYPSHWAAEHVKREIVDAVGKAIEATAPDGTHAISPAC